MRNWIMGGPDGVVTRLISLQLKLNILLGCDESYYRPFFTARQLLSRTTKVPICQKECLQRGYRDKIRIGAGYQEARPPLWSWWLAARYSLAQLQTISATTRPVIFGASAGFLTSNFSQHRPPQENCGP